MFSIVDLMFLWNQVLPLALKEIVVAYDISLLRKPIRIILVRSGYTLAALVQPLASRWQCWSPLSLFIYLLSLVQRKAKNLIF